jgi:RND family efflux transporter MFP subunit
MKTTYLYSLTIFAATLLLHSCGSADAEQSTESPSESIAVQVVPVNRGSHSQMITATGLLSTENEARYGFLIGGVIDRIYVDEGDNFKKGQLLARLKTTEIDAGVEQAQFGLEKAQRDYRRANNLLADSVATLEQVENAKTALDVAQKQLDAVEFNKQYTSIFAASDGFVSRKLANEGEVVGAGSPVLAINESNDKTGWTLKVGLSDSDWALVRIGDNATVQIPAFPEKEFSAKVYKKAQAAEPMTGIFQVELKLESNGSIPAVGMYAKAHIATSDSSGLASIPYDALIEADGDQAFVFVPSTQEGKVEKIPVTIAGFDNQVVRISHGLENVSQVITANSAFLNQNSAIRIVK